MSDAPDRRAPPGRDQPGSDRTPEHIQELAVKHLGGPTAPAGASSITPLLSVRRGAEAVAFYRAAFKAEEHSRFTDDQGHIVAQVSIDRATFIVADEAPDYDQFSPDALGGTTVRIELTVPDPDTVFKQALEAGAREVFPVADQSWGLRQGRLVDPYGHHWLVSRPLQPSPCCRQT